MGTYAYRVDKKNEVTIDDVVNAYMKGEKGTYIVLLDNPSMKESEVLEHFRFHETTITDCVEGAAMPKVNRFENYLFFVLQRLDPDSWTPSMVYVYVMKKIIVVIWYGQCPAISKLIKKIHEKPNIWDISSILYGLLRFLTKEYFALNSAAEKEIDALEESIHVVKKKHFLELLELRKKLMRFRRIIAREHDSLVRVIKEHMLLDKQAEYYLQDVVDDLSMILERAERNLEDIVVLRDTWSSMLSININEVMTVLTILTTILTPATLIAGIYGMNFHYMPELEWEYGYPFAILLMFLTGSLLLLWFWKKGWLKMMV